MSFIIETFNYFFIKNKLVGFSSEFADSVIVFDIPLGAVYSHQEIDRSIRSHLADKSSSLQIRTCTRRLSKY